MTGLSSPVEHYMLHRNPLIKSPGKQLTILNYAHFLKFNGSHHTVVSTVCLLCVCQLDGVHVLQNQRALGHVKHLAIDVL